MSTQNFFLPRDASFIWMFSYVVLSFFQKIFYRIHVEGIRNIPVHGPVVLASNHTSGHDIIILGCTSTRQIHFMAKQELFEKNALLAAYFRKAGVFPVRRGQNDKQAIAAALKYLRQGKVLGMFPEGKRFAALARGKTGVARLALKTKAHVVPEAIIGAREISLRGRFRQWHRTRVTIKYGPPVSTTEAAMDIGSHDPAKKLTDEIMIAIARMLPTEMKGAYGEVSLRAGS